MFGENPRENERKANFKKTIDNADGRRRREETTKQIRKNRKEDMLLKRRMAAPAITPSSSMDSASSSSGQITKTNYSVADIPELATVMNNTQSTLPQLEEACRGIRRILSTERNPPVKAVLQAPGVLSKLIECLTRDPEASNLVFEAAWALTNIASTSETRAVVEAGAIPPLIQLLTHAVPDVREQAAWCIGNIAGDNTEFRDLLLKSGAMGPLLMNIERPDNPTLLGNVTWAVSNLCRGKPSPAFELVAPAIPFLTQILMSEGRGVSVETKVDAAWAISYLSDGENERIEAVMSTGVLSAFISFLDDKSSPLLIPTLRCIGNFVTGNDEQTQAVIDAGILDHLPELLESGRKAIRKESCWLVSNICAGTQDQIAQVLRRTKLIHSIKDNASNSAMEVRKEAIWALSNIATIGKDAQVMGLVQADGLRPLVEILDISFADNAILVAALDGLDQILAVGARNNKDYGAEIDEYNGIEYIEKLQEHPSNAVYKKTIHILETYFGAEDDEDENMAPAMTDSGTFAFGMPSPKHLFSGGYAHPAASPLQFSFGNVVQ